MVVIIIAETLLVFMSKPPNQQQHVCGFTGHFLGSGFVGKGSDEPEENAHTHISISWTLNCNHLVHTVEITSYYQRYSC